jgi:hypothetical protein
VEAANKIIVIHAFDSLIEANIIKSRLDSLGIPCFLSEENLTSLTTALLSGGIRLHIFEHDKEEVSNIISQQRMQKTDDDDLLICPNCRSKKILSFVNDRFDPSSVVKFMLQLSKTHYCVNCEAQFDL